ncbi:hypothetical protein [Methylorubrum thiocyanatum]|uniref:hypothetical protein n=1 Tax=Methylorubrum thiocyanatum TaxID=47958 RepID=UPI0035C87E88
MSAFPDDWFGAIARTRTLPNCVTAVEVLGAGEAIRVRLHDRTAFELAAAALAPLAAGGDARDAVSDAIYRETLARQRTPTR